MTRAILVLCCLFFAGRLSAQQIVVLKDGDRISGRLVEITGGVWRFHHPAGDLAIPTADIAGFTSIDTLGMRLTGGRLLRGTISSTGRGLVIRSPDGSMTTVQPGEIEAVGDPADLDALKPVKIGFFTPFTRFWAATIAAGFSDKSGNSRSQGIAGDVEITRTSPKDRLRIRGGVNRERAEVGGGPFETTVSKFYGSVRADLFFNSRVFAFVSTSQERDTFQDLDLRSSYNGGLGLQLIQAPHMDLRFSASGGARVENFSSGGQTTSAILKTGASFKRTLGPAVFGWTLEWAPNVQDFADYTLKSDASVTTVVYKGMGFRFGVLNDFNNTPQPGVKKHDMLISTSLTYSLGR